MGWLVGCKLVLLLSEMLPAAYGELDFASREGGAR